MLVIVIVSELIICLESVIKLWEEVTSEWESHFWCRIHLWFRLMGGLQAKSMTSQRYRAVTRWRIFVTMATLWQQQDGGYALLWQRYDNNKMVAVRYYGNVMIFYIFNSTVIDWTCFFGLMFNLKGPQGQNPRTTCGSRTTVWEKLPYRMNFIWFISLCVMCKDKNK